MNKKVYIIILNYNGWKDTIECLESVLKSDYDDYQIIVVDNNSPNNSIDYLIKWAKGELCLWLPDNNSLKHLSFPLNNKPIDFILYTKEEAINGGDKEKEDKLENPIIFIQAGENKGFAAGNNIGIKYALAKNDFDYIWLLNNDTVIEKDTLKKLVESYRENFLLSSRLMKNRIIIQADGGKFNRFFLTSSHIHENKKISNNLNYVEPDYLVGASLLINKKELLVVGLLDEDYFLYYEDLDYSLRAKQQRLKLKVIYDSIVYHKESASTSKVNRKFIVNLYFRNRLKVAKKFVFNMFFVKLGLIFSIVKRFFLGKWEECKIIFRIMINE